MHMHGLSRYGPDPWKRSTQLFPSKLRNYSELTGAFLRGNRRLNPLASLDQLLTRKKLVDTAS